MTTKVYTVTVVARVPSESGPHTLTEVGRLNGAFGLSFTDRLNRPSECFVSFIPDNQDDEVLEWLKTPAHEIWVWRNDELAFAGPSVLRQAQLGESGIVFSLQCRSALHYIARRMLSPLFPVTYTDKDQTTIAADLINLVQSESYSNYGIDTSQVQPSGVLRSRSYLTDGFHFVGARIEELAAVQNGFDFDIDHATREFRTYYPQRGIDKTEVIVLDRSNMVVPAATWLWGSEDYVSNAYAASPLPQGMLVGSAENANVLTTFGRADVGASYQDIITQSTIDEHAGRLASERSEVLYLPAPQVLVSGFESGDIEPGDTIETSYDYGMGTETTTARVVTIVTTIYDDGNETLGLELL